MWPRSNFDVDFFEGGESSNKLTVLQTCDCFPLGQYYKCSVSVRKAVPQVT